MQTFVINLLRAPDRLNDMQERLAAHGLSHKVLVATDALTLTEQQRQIDHDRCRRFSHYPLTDGEIACRISHHRVLELIANGHDRMATVFEDDAALLPNFVPTLNAIKALNSPFDFIFLHRALGRKWSFVSCYPLTPDNALGRVRYQNTGTVAYVASREGARKFLAQYTGAVGLPIDTEMHRYWASRLDIYGLQYPVVEHADGGHSCIDESGGQNRPRNSLPYPDHSALRIKAMRALTGKRNSVVKRISFWPYVWKGRKNFQTELNRG